MNTSDAANNPLVEISNLGKKYGSFQAVDDLSLSIDQGEIFALLGPNGAGKTTTIRMLMGILQPTTGTASINGLDCFQDRADVMKHVGYMPDEPVFHDYLRGSELIRFCGELRGLPSDVIETRSKGLVERFDLEGDLEEYATNYSRGMKKKLAAVITFLHNPSLVILDEPTNGLDPHTTRTFHAMIREYVQGGTSVFFTTHLLDQAEKLCTRVGILSKGKLAAIGELDELRTRMSAESSLEEMFFRITSDDPSEASHGEGA